MATIPVEVAVLRDLLARRDDLVRAITAGTASGDWDQVMALFEGLLVAIKQLEESLEAVKPQAS
jgi:molecular chaperone GrpE (heat shock protein)